MKTSVELDEDKLKVAKDLFPSMTTRKVLDLAIDALIARGRRNKLAGLLGTRFFDGDLSATRESYVGAHR